MADKEPNSKVILVAGAARGIGKALAEGLSTSAGIVVIADSDLPAAENAAKEITGNGKPARAYEVDVTKASAVRRMAREILEEFGRIDVVCANAGIVGPGPFEQTTDSDFDRVIDVNTKGVIYTCQSFIESMIKRRSGRILVTASYNAFRTGTHVIPYRVSKAALIMYVRSLSLVAAPHNITVNALCPGVTLTEMQLSYAEETATLQHSTTEEYLDRRRQGIPMQQFTSTEDIVNLARFLVSEGARLITGQAIGPDGGVLASS